MSKGYFEEFPPELILLLSPSLSTISLNALASTCRRFHEILQPELDGRITPELGRELLIWTAESKPHIIAKLLSPPHSIPPSPTSLWSMTALHVAAKARNMDTAKLLLDAGANPAAEYDQDEYQPLHMAAENKDLEMMKLLLDHGAPIDSKFGCDGCSESALHYACSIAHVDMINLLLERGASLECRGHYGPALGFAVHRRNFEVVKLLLSKGADATVSVPLFVLLVGGPPYPHKANLLYIAMGLRHPTSDRHRRFRKQQSTPPRWEGLPLSDGKKKLMALLLAHGASKDTTMATITKHLAALSKEAQYTEEEYLEVIAGMLKEAEDAIPDYK
ncbi:ANK-REP-REGION domain-containing protein [Mycena venus]|uniref:ANK-REP-REGION domain-containing protein n=1 Tax=Mycena venus TaxID=2733690 RepID=A0A8H7CZM6_9AGAR|nr:ANK-REP-REGION domain-containing protein [Mycena venus]